MGGTARGIRFVAVAVAVVLALTGCIHGFGGSDDGRDNRLYTGPMPTPAALPNPPDIPPFPVPPADGSDQAAFDDYMAATDAYNAARQNLQPEVMAHYEALVALAEVTKKGGKESVAAWQSLFVTAGIAVAGADGKPIELGGRTGFGWPLMDAQIRMHALLATTDGGLRLVDLADALSAAPEFAGTNVAEVLSSELTESGDGNFSMVLELFEKGLSHELMTKPAEDIVLSWSGVGLILHRLSAELAVSESNPSGKTVSGPAAPTAQAITASYGSVPMASTGRPCEVKIDNPWAAELLSQLNKAHATFGFDKVIELVDEGTGSGIGAKIGLARLISAFATMLAKAAALDAKFTLADAPLVRTKNTQPGEVRDLTLTYSFSKDSWEDIRGCMNLFMSPFGLEVPGAQSGAADKIDVQLASDDPSVLRIGDGKGGNQDVTRGRTDSNGEVKFKVSGAPQSDILPDGAEPVDVDVTLRAVSNLGGNDFFKDLSSLPWDALDAASTGGLTAIPQVLSRMKLITQTSAVPVRDWSLEANFEATVVGSLESRSASHVWAENTCSSGWTVHTSSTDDSMSMATDAVPVTAVLLSNPGGNLGDQAAVFTPTGEEFDIYGYSPMGVLMFELPVHYTATKQYAKPAVGPVPPERLHTGGGCADARSDGAPPPESTPDCGKRQYSAMLEVAMPSARTLQAGASSMENHGSQWQECGGENGPVLAPSTLNECGAKPKGGKMPPISDIFDSTKRILEVEGSMSCSTVREGYSYELDYQWTLVLCRVVDGKSAC